MNSASSPYPPFLKFLDHQPVWLPNALYQGTMMVSLILATALTPRPSMEKTVLLVACEAICMVIIAMFAAIDAIQKAQQKVEKQALQRSTTGEFSEPLQVVPRFDALFRLNFFTGLFYLPVALLILTSAFMLLTALVDHPLHLPKNSAQLLSVGLMMIPFMSMVVSFWLIRHLVARFIQIPDSSSTQEAVRHETREMLSGIAGLVLYAAMSLAIIYTGQLVKAPVPLIALLLIAFNGVILMLSMVYFPRRRQQQMEKALIETHGLEALSVRDFQRKTYQQSRSIHSQVIRRGRWVLVMLVMVPLITLGSLLMVPLLLSGLEPETVKNIASFPGIVALAGFMLVFFGNLYRPFPRSIVLDRYADRIKTALHQADYPMALSLADQMLDELENWETYATAGHTYATAGKLERGEQLIRAGIQDTMAVQNLLESADQNTRRNRGKLKRNRYNEILGDYLTKLGEVLLFQQRYTEADEAFQNATKFVPQSPALALLKVASVLHQKETPLQSPTRAYRLLEDAYRMHQADQSAHGFVESRYLALWAWSSALQGHNTEVDDLIQKAFTKIEADNIPALAEIYYLNGMIAFDGQHLETARAAFQEVIKIDPQGLNGLLAQQALDSMITRE